MNLNIRSCENPSAAQGTTTSLHAGSGKAASKSSSHSIQFADQLLQQQAESADLTLATAESGTPGIGGSQLQVGDARMQTDVQSGDKPTLESHRNRRSTPGGAEASEVLAQQSVQNQPEAIQQKPERSSSNSSPINAVSDARTTGSAAAKSAIPTAGPGDSTLQALPPETISNSQDTHLMAYRPLSQQKPSAENTSSSELGGNPSSAQTKEHVVAPRTDIIAPTAEQSSNSSAPPQVQFAPPAEHPTNLRSVEPQTNQSAVAPLGPMQRYDHDGDGSLNLRSPDFGERFAMQISDLTVNRIDSAQLRVSPAELGPIALQIKITEAGAHISLQASHSETLQAIEQSVPTLRHLLAEQGVRVDSIDLSGTFFAGQSGSNAGDSGNSRGYDRPNQPAPMQASPSLSADEQPASDRSSAKRHGLLDVFA
jgi:flagellar hook-length control protein FliK